jgi:tripartite-type tricarboxylate transporter receptor subunit TctC
MKKCWTALLGLFLCSIAHTQTWPAKPITILVPLGAGSSVDIIARLYAGELSKALGQEVRVELRPGAGGTTGTAYVAKSPPDGYLLTIASNGTHAINMQMYAKPGYDAIRDFAPIALVASVVNVMIVPASNPAKSPQDVISATKLRKPGELTYSSGGNGTTHHFSGVIFSSMAGLNLTHVPYKASVDGINDVMNGKISMGFFNMPTVLTQIREGKLKGLAVTGLQRSSFVPDLPTLDEAGLKGFDVNAWFGFVAPAGTPESVIERLNREINRITAHPDIHRQLNEQGFEIFPPQSAQDFGRFMQQELVKWVPIVKASGIRIE